LAIGKKVVMTDHSLYGFDGPAYIHLNKTMKWVLTDVEACIAVSHVGRENL